MSAILEQALLLAQQSVAGLQADLRSAYVEIGRLRLEADTTRLATQARNKQQNARKQQKVPPLYDSTTAVIPQLNDSITAVIPQLNGSNTAVIPQLNGSKGGGTLSPSFKELGGEGDTPCAWVDETQVLPDDFPISPVTAGLLQYATPLGYDESKLDYPRPPDPIPVSAASRAAMSEWKRSAKRHLYTP